MTIEDSLLMEEKDKRERAEAIEAMKYNFNLADQDVDRRIEKGDVMINKILSEVSNYNRTQLLEIINDYCEKYNVRFRMIRISHAYYINLVERIYHAKEATPYFHTNEDDHRKIEIFFRF